MGVEFFNAIAQQYLKRKGVGFDTTQNLDIKGAFFGRFNGSLKGQI